MNRLFDLPGYDRVPEPNLRFHPDREADRDVHPLSGLLRFGPYSRSLISAVIDPIRIATIYPAGFRKRVDRLFSELEQNHAPRERKNYLPAFPGFARVFGLRAVQAPDDLQLELPVVADREVIGSTRSHLRLAEILIKAINQLLAFRNEFDVALIFLPDKWSAAFYGEVDDFDLHDYIKAVNASRGIPTQLLQEASALSYPCRASVMLRLSIALYSKAGGVPWKISDTDPDSAYIGLSYALRSEQTGKRRFVTCCSQVFDALYDRLPVTLSYAGILARTIKRMPTIHSRPYEFRFFM